MSTRSVDFFTPSNCRPFYNDEAQWWKLNSLLVIVTSDLKLGPNKSIWLEELSFHMFEQSLIKVFEP